MINWQLVPALRVAIVLAIGIAFARPPFPTYKLQLLVATVALIAIALFFWPLPLERKSSYRGSGVLLATFAVGAVLGFYHLPQALSSKGADAIAFIAELERPPTKATIWYSVDAKITSFRSDTGWSSSDSRIRILLPPARVTPEMTVGATYLFNSKVKEISNASNPHAFDYASYLKSQGITLQAFAPPAPLQGDKDTGVMLLKEGKRPTYLADIRAWLARRIELALPSPNEAAVAKALFLGDKSSLSADTRKNYTRTGAVHVLAVSGLHTGIIASMILGLFGLFTWRKELKWVKLMLFWLGLFGYAALTGFSPSVQRSAVMFGILFAGKILRKDTNGFNSLGLSAIVLLAFDPQLLFELGFQLSYCAVAGILAFYPSLRKRFASKNYWFNAIGELNAVSLSATLGTLPLTVFYFHQFPVYFLLSGIFAVPLVGLALPFLLGAIGIDLLFYLFGSSAYWAYIPAYLLVWLCNACLELISSLPNALVSGLWPSVLTSFLAMLAVIFFGAATLRRRKRLYWTALSAGLLWAGSITFTTVEKLQTNQVIVYNLRNEVFIDAFQNGTVFSSNQKAQDFNSDRSLEIIKTHRAAMNARLDTSRCLLVEKEEFQQDQIVFGIANSRRFAILPSQSSSILTPGPKLDFLIISEPKAVHPALLSKAFPKAKFVLNREIPLWKKKEWQFIENSIHALKSEGAYILHE